MLKRIVAVLVILVMLLSLSSLAVAHEMWPPYSLSWYYRTSSNQAYLKVNQDLITETQYLLRDYVNYARSRWNSNSGGRVVMNSASFSTATVCFATPSEQFWLDMVGSYWRYEAVAWTKVFNLNGTDIDGDNVSYSNPNIKFSSIYVSPYTWRWEDYSVSQLKGILAHELGHSLTLGHCDESDVSIMDRHASHQATYPTLHDINDVNLKYP